MTCHYPDRTDCLIGRAAKKHLPQPIRNTAQIWVLTRNQYGLFSALVPQTSFDGKTSVVIANYRLFFQAGV